MKPSKHAEERLLKLTIYAQMCIHIRIHMYIHAYVYIYIARPRGTTDKRRTTTTNSSSAHHHDSAPPRLQPFICTGAELIHPVHGPPKLRATEATNRNEVTFLPFSRVLYKYMHIQATYLSVYTYYMT